MVVVTPNLWDWSTAQSDEMVEAAGRWGFWLEHVYNCTGAPGGPQFEVTTLDDGDNARDVELRLADPRVDLTVIDKAILGLAGLGLDSTP